MNLKRSGVGKGLLTETTYMSFIILLMHLTNMELQVIFQSKRLGTKCAREDLFSMCLFVSIKSGRRAQTLPANWALVVTNTQVARLLVNSFRSVLCECFWAIFAFVRLKNEVLIRK